MNLRVTIFTGTEVDISVEMHQNANLNPMNITTAKELYRGRVEESTPWDRIGQVGVV